MWSDFRMRWNRGQFRYSQLYASQKDSWDKAIWIAASIHKSQSLTNSHLIEISDLPKLGLSFGMNNLYFLEWNWEWLRMKGQ